MLDEGRKAIRSLAARPGLALGIIGTLAIGVGATSATFSVVDTVVLRPLPYPAADRLVAVSETTPQQTNSLIARVRLEDWERLTSTFEGFAGCYAETVTDTSGTLPERLDAQRITPRFFQVLGVSPARGRGFTADEERFGGPGAIVISDAAWRTQYGADPTVLGRTLRIGDRERVVVGIMPPSFQYPSPDTDAWIPAQPLPAMAASRETRWYVGVARMKAGIGLAQARQDLAAAQAQLARQFPATDGGGRSAVLEPLDEAVVGTASRSLWLLFGAVVLLLVAACGNIAGLLLADAARRESEVAIQFALGAPRGTIVRQRFLEGLVLAAIGAAAGLALATVGIGLVRRLAPALPRIHELRLDWSVVAFTLVSGLVTAVAFALLPAWHATRRVPAPRTGASRVVGGRKRLQPALVAAQLALALVLLAGAGVLLRSVAELQAVAPGFDAEHVLSFRMTATWNESGRADLLGGRHQRTLERLAAIPGVIAASHVTALPATPAGAYPPAPFRIAGQADDPTRLGFTRQVSPNYFRVMRMPIVEGEDCRPDIPNRPARHVVVNQAFAARYFPGGSAIGASIAVGPGGSVPIIGIAGDARERGLSQPPEPTIYSCGMSFYPDPFIVVRMDPARPVSVETIRAAMREIEPSRAVYVPRLLSDVLAETRSQPRLNSTLLGVFAGIAVLLVAVGLYAMLSQFVSEHTREIGVRLALGARPVRIVVDVLGRTSAVVTIGLTTGLVASLVLARFLSALVYGVSPRDPVTLFAVTAVLTVVAIAAALPPAWRAAGMDPLAALRSE